jgi:type VI secretion system secreted protein VgrG
VKSDSTLGHGGFNEFTFDDSKSEEKVQFRAEKDLNSNVRNIETRKVAEAYSGSNKSPSRSTEIVKGSDKLKIKDGDWIVDVTGAISITATEKIEIEVGASKITMLPGSVTIKSGDITIDGTSTVVVKGGTIMLN